MSLYRILHHPGALGMMTHSGLRLGYSPLTSLPAAPLKPGGRTPGKQAHSRAMLRKPEQVDWGCCEGARQGRERSRWWEEALWLAKACHREGRKRSGSFLLADAGIPAARRTLGCAPRSLGTWNTNSSSSSTGPLSTMGSGALCSWLLK